MGEEGGVPSVGVCAPGVEGASVSTPAPDESLIPPEDPHPTAPRHAISTSVRRTHSPPPAMSPPLQCEEE